MFPLIKFYNFQIPTFFLVISITLTALLFWLSSRLDSENGKNFNRKVAYNLSLIIMIFGFWGARLFHVFYEEWSFYQEYPVQIFKFWNGGFIYFGGMVAALCASYIYLKHEKQNFTAWANFMTPMLSASYALGRIGCFFEGCCYGNYCELPWSIQARHPTQIYMMLGEFFILGLLLLIEKRGSVSNVTGYLFFKWLLLHSIFRFIFEYFRADDRGDMIFGLSISQIFCVVLICVSGFMILKNKKAIFFKRSL